MEELQDVAGNIAALAAKEKLTDKHATDIISQ